MADPRTRSAEENQRELRRLQQFYASLPPEKRQAQEPHLRKRMQELVDAINGPARGGSNSSGGGGLVESLSKGALWIAVMLAVVAAGFFGVMTWARL